MGKKHSVGKKQSIITKKLMKPQPKRDIYGYYHDKQDPYNPVCGEVAMWRAVITQALMDASTNSQKSEMQYYKREARNWLLHESDDFIAVCELADLDPHYVSGMVKAALGRGCRWREPSVKPIPQPARGVLAMEFKSFTPPPLSSIALIAACA